jgi:LmbE family N-acetylglucosaminyl deacetylase
MHVVQIVAHEDDDILFMSPPLIEVLQHGGAVTSVYLTAGDDGRDQAYWSGREDGTLAAYGSMLGKPSNFSWQRTTEPVGAYRWTRCAASSAPVDLFFCRLPDGNVDGSGFASTGNVSLKMLLGGATAALLAVDGTDQSYTLDQLRDTLAALIQTKAPDNIWLQDFVHGATTGWSDHADHLAGATIALQAVAQSGVHALALGWEGYQDSNGPPNVFPGPELTAKTDAFNAYLAHDANASMLPPYTDWISRACPVAVRIF